MSEESHSVRLGQVEADVKGITGEIGGLKTEMNGLKVGMRGLGDVLERIESSVASSQQQWQEDKQAARINPIALATVLISIISILVGGAWIISGAISTASTRLEEQDKSTTRIMALRDREFDIIEKRIDRVEARRGDPPTSP